MFTRANYDTIFAALCAYFNSGEDAFTHKTLVSQLLTCPLFVRAAQPPAESPPVPRIHSKSQHFRFALLVLAGYPYDNACGLLGANPRTAERWRTDLRQTASLYFGRRVTYEFAARYALDFELRHACEAARQGSVRETPQ